MKKRLFLLIVLIGSPCFAKNYDLIVSQSPLAGELKTINEALLVADQRANKNTLFTIFIKNGIYHEKINIKTPNIWLIGEDQNKTVIEYNLAAGMLDKEGKKVGTTGSAIFIVSQSGIIISHLTIKNSFDYPANQALSKTDPKRLADTQAVTVLINSNSDRVHFNKVTLMGYQDTLYVKDNSRSYFTQSTISGHVDFIFGGGTTMINDCELIARARYDTQETYGYLTAPSTNISQPYGLIIINSRLTKEKDVPANSFALGRPWHPTTTFADGRYADPNAIGSSVFINNQIDDHIYGWDKMSGRDIEGQQIWFLPQDSRFYEFNNQGSGARIINNAYIITEELAAHYAIENVFSDWPNQFLNPTTH